MPVQAGPRILYGDQAAVTTAGVHVQTEELKTQAKKAAQALMLACRARALMDGRYAPSVDDVVALAPPVLRHRMAVSFAGRAEGVSVARLIDEMAAPLR